MLVHFILTLLLALLLPVDAFAWGPGTHLETAITLLKDVSMFSSVIIPLLQKYRDEFIYGMVSADLLVGKKYAGHLHHCHNWDVAWRILERCRTDREKASAYGYLTHLASDIIAHNYYIPYMVIKSFDAAMKNHTYWELRFDVHVKPFIWDKVKEITGGDFHEFDRLLESTLKRPLFSFKTNKRIFRTILLLQQFKQLRQTVKIHSDFSMWPLSGEEVRHYKYLILRTTREFLRDLKDAKCLNGSPAGLARLNWASNIRKSLKRLISRDIIKRKTADRFVKMLRSDLRRTIFEGDAVLPGSIKAL